MAKTHPGISQELADWIARQPLFFNATAPLSAKGHVNLSPRGLDAFRVLGPKRVCYLDFIGSGNETAAHLDENGRITIMFCAFDEPPRVLRLYGSGKVHLPGDSDWDGLRARFPDDFIGVRQIVDIEVERVQTSCGFGVPLMTHIGQRDRLHQWAKKRGPEGLQQYHKEKNSISIDGLPAPRRGD